MKGFNRSNKNNQGATDCVVMYGGLGTWQTYGKWGGETDRFQDQGVDGRVFLNTESNVLQDMD
jgi:hypothetical protein